MYDDAVQKLYTYINDVDLNISNSRGQRDFSFLHTPKEEKYLYIQYLN